MENTLKQKIVLVATIIFILALTLTVLFVLFGNDNSTSKYNGTVSCIFIDYKNNNRTALNLSGAEQANVLYFLNNGEWGYDVTNCGHDYEFILGNKTIRYHSECGTFIDINKKRHKSMSEEEQALINEILGVE